MILGSNVQLDNALGHVTGELKYIRDLPRCEDELFVELVLSNIACGKVVNINKNDALKVAGVCAVFTAADIPGKNLIGTAIADEYFMVDEKIEFAGQLVAIIAAESEHAAKQAKHKLIVEVEAMEPVLDIKEAIYKEHFLAGGQKVERGNIELINLATHILSGTFFSAGQEHAYLECQTAIAYPDDSNALKIIAATQCPMDVQHTIACVLAMPMHMLTVETKPVGGAFGGKETNANIPAAAAALVAYKTKRAARVQLSVEDDMHFTGKRHPFFNEYRVGFDNEGRIIALDIKMYADGGAYLDLSSAVLERALLNAENAYFIPNFKVQGRIVKTNHAPNTAFRGFGAPQGVVNIESIIEDIAAHLSIDALAVRTINLYGGEGRNITPYGQVFSDSENKLIVMLKKIKMDSGYDKRRAELNEYNKNKNAAKIRGISCTPIKYGVAFTTKFINQASALVNIYNDGSIQINIGGVEIGQGLYTKMRQIAADEFCVATENIRIMCTATDKIPNASPTAASSDIDLNGSVVLRACQKIKKRLLLLAKNILAVDSESEIIWSIKGIHKINDSECRITFSELVSCAYQNCVQLNEMEFFFTPGLSYNRANGHGNAFPYYTQGWSVAEVEIDKFSGYTKVKRVDMIMDIGKSLNPGIDIGQIYGGFVQGMGWLMLEELKYNADGILLTSSPATYKVPMVNEMPEDFRVSWLNEKSDNSLVSGSKGVGEPPFVMAISVWTAIKNALQSVKRKKSFESRVPFTSEMIMYAIDN